MDEYTVKTFTDKQGRELGWCVVDSEGNEVTSLTTDRRIAEDDAYALSH